MASYTRSWGGPSNFGSKAVDSVSTPNYRHLKKIGKLPKNPYSMSEMSAVSQTVDTYNGPRNQWSSFGYPDHVHVLNTGFFNSPYFGTVTMGNGYGLLLVEVENQLSKKLRSTPVNLGIALGEASETAKLFINNANKLANTMICLKKKDFGGATRHLFGSTHSRKESHRQSQLAVTDPAKLLLEYQFGMVPVVNDIVGAAQVLSDRENRPEKVDMRAYRTAILDFAGSLPISVDRSVSENLKGFASVHGRFTAEIENPFAHAFSSLGLDNIAATAWELVPLSFLIDTVVDIGSTLASLQPVLGLSDSCLCFTYGGNISYTGSTDFPGWKTTGTMNGRVRKRHYSFRQPQFNLVSLDIPGKHMIPTTLALLQTSLAGLLTADWVATNKRSR